MINIRAHWLALATVLIAGFALAAPGVSDARPPGKPSRPALSIQDAVAYEGEGLLSFPITLDRPAPWALRVVAVPLRGTARPVKDYGPGAVSTTIPVGATEGSLEVRIRDNEVVGPDVTLTLRIVAAPGAIVAKGTAIGTIRDDEPLTINLLHINDHHSNLQPVNNTLDLGSSGGSFSVPFGGFPRVTAKIKALESQLDNVVKIHAGDAITGTLFYTLFQGEADADLMNTACFDVFALGNHEFDDGDGNLARFLDFLGSDPACDTVTVAANVVPQIGTPLAPVTANDYIQPYAIKEFQGQKVAFIGIDIAEKTRFSSQPLPTTQFLDEVKTAQAYVDELSAIGIDNIVLVTHYGYENDLALARAVTGVDAIVGGDSHTLLGDLGQYGLPSGGNYPTLTLNADGDPVCVVQAWQYAQVVGELAVTFREGKVETCGGTPHLLLGDVFQRSRQPIADPERSEILALIDADPSLGLVTPDPTADAILAEYAAQVDELSKQIIGQAGEVICERRVPTLPRGSAPCDGDAVSLSGAQLNVNGGFSQQVVTDAFLARAFRADLALQNGGGVRITIPEGDITIGTAYTLLPFSNTLVELELSGQEVLDSIEDGLDFYASNPGGNTGAFPYGSHIRWDIDMTQPKGARISDVEVKDRATGIWAPLDPSETYIVVTNSFLANGGDGYTTFKDAAADGRVTDTFINYAQGFVDYVVQDLGGGNLFVPPPLDFSTQSFAPLP
ncbi:bifunctional metallophosphatase/5'-nucleotidase [Thiocapsa rosea]|uniref:5'-nucleotidase n=1 Tax=Thiocapsa rosea TaxID=69360 RepID=A0A495VDL2_9GAMM|nr:5'-nucleotidase C-terminal domain-containing protein [Thiocapsa rosea]RKT46525.1 5'-nucleotidase [Thiocapsa rosea]